ncbi:MAG: serine protease [Acidobacteriota bacterium]
MARALVLVTLLLATPRAPVMQPTGILHIRVVLADAAGTAIPVPRHPLLISENPTSAVPRRILTTMDGTADVSLRPGNYTVESDRPFAFEGRVYQWTRAVDVAAGRGTVLELNAANAQVEALASASTPSGPAEPDPAGILMRWRDSVVGLWTPTTHASAFIVDGRGLLATSLRGVGTATAVEVQLAPDVKVAGTVIVADAARNVAILRIDPALVASARPVPTGCGQPGASPPGNGDEIFAIGVPLRQFTDISSGNVIRVEPHAIAASFGLPSGSAGGPAFAADGSLIGLTSTVNDDDAGLREDARVVRVADICGALAAAEPKLSDVAVPGAGHLPMEPARPWPVDALRDAAGRRGGSLSPYQLTSSDFDVAFITPVMTYGAAHPPARAAARGRSGDRPVERDQPYLRPLMDFGNWSDYVAEYPPVLLVRVTPKMVENFWTTVARGAARTQGVSLPPIKHFKSGFLRLRAFCGAAEVTPIHPFKIERRVSETEAIYEGLYVFDPAALGPACAPVRLELYSEKEPDKADSRTVDPTILEQIRQDFTF